MTPVLGCLQLTALGNGFDRQKALVAELHHRRKLQYAGFCCRNLTLGPEVARHFAEALTLLHRREANPVDPATLVGTELPALERLEDVRQCTTDMLKMHLLSVDTLQRASNAAAISLTASCRHAHQTTLHLGNFDAQKTTVLAWSPSECRADSEQWAHLCASCS